MAQFVANNGEGAAQQHQVPVASREQNRPESDCLAVLALRGVEEAARPLEVAQPFVSAASTGVHALVQLILSLNPLIAWSFLSAPDSFSASSNFSRQNSAQVIGISLWV
jgi:hypothetical protein